MKYILLNEFNKSDRFLKYIFVHSVCLSLQSTCRDFMSLLVLLLFDFNQHDKRSNGKPKRTEENIFIFNLIGLDVSKWSSYEFMSHIPSLSLTSPSIPNILNIQLVLHIVFYIFEKREKKSNNKKVRIILKEHSESRRMDSRRQRCFIRMHTEILCVVFFSLRHRITIVDLTEKM